MLNNYKPLLKTYEALWAKYGPKPRVIGNYAPKRDTMTQEQSVAWSLKLLEVFDAIAQESSLSPEAIQLKFKEGVQEAPAETNKLEAGLARIGNAQTIIQQWKLFFSISSLDDLFLLEEDEKSSVMIIE